MQRDTNHFGNGAAEEMDSGRRRNALNRWNPMIGTETRSLLDHLGLPDPSRSRVLDEAHEILSKCIPSSEMTGNSTGLVIGNIQSGKTMSFTTVAAFARDNKYRMVIIITGTSIPLFNQSRLRLESDLRLNTRPDRKWQHFPNPRIGSRETITDTLRDWDDQSVPEEELQTILITVMKNHRHLTKLIELLDSLDMTRVPAIVIDDEADQAGLNTRVNQGDESTTYRNLLALRRVLPHHTFLQYTATPQAPLLINLIDVLSPQFAEILVPGDDYTGGREFFNEHDELELIRTIPAHEIPSATNPVTEPPDSLVAAMRLFFVGVRAGMIANGGQGNRSMMVHPSQQTLRHAEYFTWVRLIKEEWQRILELPPTDPDRTQLLEEFNSAHTDLAATVQDLVDFETMVPGLARAIRRTQITEMNASRGHTPSIDWRSSYAHILVGGRAMDRGFTVEGLTVTYMPRGIGVGNADTIQQRARFFGYKRPYIGYCRIFLEAVAEQAYRNYVQHEEDIQSQLIEHRDNGRPLPDWKRAFFLNSNLRPTRNNVLSLDYMQGQFNDNWFSPDRPHDSEEATISNRCVIDEFVRMLSLLPDSGHADRTSAQRHLTTAITLDLAYRELLTELRVTDPTDSQKYIGAMLQIRRFLELNPDAPCQVYLMSPREQRTRTLNANDEIPNLFQGEYPVEPLAVRGSIYPGDRKIKAARGVTIQIHKLDVSRGGNLLANIPVIAIWLPSETAQGWLVQDQA